MAPRVTPSTDETPHRLGRFVFRVMLGSALMLAAIPATAESPGRDQDEPASDWRQEVGFRATNDALLDWLDQSPAGSLAAATWRDAVAEAEGIEIDEDHLERALAGLARAQGTGVPAIRRTLDDAGKLGAFRAQLRRERVIKHLLGELVEETQEEGDTAEDSSADD